MAAPKEHAGRTYECAVRPSRSRSSREGVSAPPDARGCRCRSPRSGRSGSNGPGQGGSQRANSVKVAVARLVHDNRPPTSRSVRVARQLSGNAVRGSASARYTRSPARGAKAGRVGESVLAGAMVGGEAPAGAVGDHCGPLGLDSQM